MLIRRGASMADVSAQDIKAWVRANPGPGRQLLNTNPSFVFFRKLETLREIEKLPEKEVNVH